MSSKLKNDPVEWRKFVLAMIASQSLLLWMLMTRVRLPQGLVFGLAGLLLLLAVLAVAFPRGCRPVYFVGMKLGLAISGVVTRVVLFAMFVLVVTPIGLILRKSGQDPLALRKPEGTGSYWRKAEPYDDFERLF